ncbi:hypothetical protein [Gordonia sp. ABSL49_1]|nr:hypothetical protein [Gordonia sp. ABSL49_1]MCH5642287.1 hypothetical protein [Gordonia sp. ABSL49_1]
MRGNERLAEMLADPETAQRVGVIRAEMAQADRAHASLPTESDDSEGQE